MWKRRPKKFEKETRKIEVARDNENLDKKVEVDESKDITDTPNETDLAESKHSSIQKFKESIEKGIQTLNSKNDKNLTLNNINVQEKGKFKVTTDKVKSVFGDASLKGKRTDKPAIGYIINYIEVAVDDKNVWLKYIHNQEVKHALIGSTGTTGKLEDLEYYGEFIND